MVELCVNITIFILFYRQRVAYILAFGMSGLTVSEGMRVRTLKLLSFSIFSHMTLNNLYTTVDDIYTSFLLFSSVDNS